VVVAVLAMALIYLALPDEMSAGPPWLLLVVLAPLLVLAVVAHRVGRRSLNEALGHAIALVMTAALVFAIVKLIVMLPQHREPPVQLLRAAGLLWFATVLVFALWYWRLDAGGPNRRDQRRHAGEAHTRGAFLFPQMTLDPATLRNHCDVDTHWHPEFVDYLFLAFTASTAFSPTDVPVLSRWAKVLMMTQAVMSLATIALLAARAVNIL
jgi:protein-S-isoprenylcysteine O-methyltransferase Ste14